MNTEPRWTPGVNMDHCEYWDALSCVEADQALALANDCRVTDDIESLIHVEPCGTCVACREMNATAADGPQGGA